MATQALGKIFGKDFVGRCEAVVCQLPLLMPFKEQGFFGPTVDVSEVLSNFDTFAEDEANHVELVAAIVDSGIKNISDSIYQPYDKLGELSNLSMSARKDAQVKFVAACNTFVERSVRAFLHLQPDAVTWIQSQLPDVLNKHSIESRLSVAPSWQARLFA